MSPRQLADSILDLARILDEGFPKYKNQEGFNDQSCAKQTNCLLSSLPDFLSPLGKEVSVDSFVTGNLKGKDSLVTDNNSDRVQKLDSEDRSAAIDALTTAISMKQIAMSKESKKRSKSNTVTIEKWLKEIESLELAIAYLKLI